LRAPIKASDLMRRAAQITIPRFEPLAERDPCPAIMITPVLLATRWSRQ
jgi:hypothetical protein